MIGRFLGLEHALLGQKPPILGPRGSILMLASVVLASLGRPMALGSPAGLFADAEVAKDHVQDILDVDAAGEAPERAGGDPQLFGQQLFG